MRNYLKYTLIFLLGLMLISCGGGTGDKSASPIAVDLEVTIKQNETKSIDVSDIGKTVAIEDIIIGKKPIGSIRINEAKTIIFYTPKEDFVGTDHFTYTVKDKEGLVSAPATITIIVIQVFGKLSISKVVSGDIEDPQVFTIQLDCTDNNFDDDDILLAHGEKYEISNIPIGTSCNVTELDIVSSPKGYTYSTPIILSSDDAVIKENSTLVFKVINTLVKNNTGSLLINNTVIGSSRDTQSFTINLECTNDNNTVIVEKSFTLKHAGFIVESELLEGLICTVVEVIQPEPPVGYQYEDSIISPIQGVVIKNKETVNISVSNKLLLIERPFKIKILDFDDYNPTSNSFKIPIAGNGHLFNVDCNDDGVNEVTGSTTEYICKYGYQGLSETISISGKFPQINFSKSDCSLLVSVEQWGTTVWKSMRNAFDGCSNLEINASDSPNLSLVNDMSFMFNRASSLNQNISNWDVSNVTTMRHLFSNAKSFNQNIGNWNVSNVTDMSYMFSAANAFNQNIGNWNVGNVSTMEGMFEGTELSSLNYDTLLIGWSNLPILQPNVIFHAGNSIPTPSSDLVFYIGDSITLPGAGLKARDKLTAPPYNWKITDGNSFVIE